MQSVKSYFNFTLFRKNITRFWPVWALYLVTWVFILPVSTYLQCSGLPTTDWQAVCQRIVDQHALGMVGSGGVILAAVFGLLAAMCVFSYLYNNRSAGMTHALPLRREGLFLTNYLSGLAFFVGAHAVVLVVTLLTELALGTVNFGALFMWFCAVTLLCFFFYSFAVFCAMFTGNLLALPAFYGILNFLALGLFTFFSQILRDFLYGFQSAGGMEEVVMALTPIAQLIQNISAGPVADTGIYRLFGMGTVFTYAFVGLIFAVLALALYRRRQLETAGDVVAVGWVKPVFKYGVALSFGIVLGFGLHNWFSTRGGTAWSLLPWMVGCGIVGYFAAEMLLQKSFKVFRAWKGCCVFAVAMTGLVAILATGGLGFESRLPVLSDVTSITLSGLYPEPYDEGHGTTLTLTTESDLAAISAVHQELLAARHDRFSAAASDDYTSLKLQYTLKNGTMMLRHYDYVPLSSKDVENENTLTGKLTAVLNTPENIKAAYAALYKYPRETLSSCDLTLSTGGAYEDVTSNTTLSSAQSLLLYDAVVEDLAAGRLGARYLITTDNHPFLMNQIQFNFPAPVQPGGDTRYASTSSATYTVSVTPQVSSTSTIKVLRDLGFGDNLQLEGGTFFKD